MQGFGSPLEVKLGGHLMTSIFLATSAGESNEKGKWTLRDDYLTKHAFILTYLAIIRA